MSGLDTNVRALIDAAILNAPYSRLLGLELLECVEDRAVLRLPFREEVVTVGDTVHGGALASLIDTAATAAFWCSNALQPGSRGATISLTVNYVSAARACDAVAEARVRRRGREICSGDVTVRAGDTSGEEVAIALVSYKLSPPRT